MTGGGHASAHDAHQDRALRRRVLAWCAVAAVVGLVVGFASIGVVYTLRADKGTDFTLYFLPAARAVLEGRGLYDVPGYLYPPPFAVLIAPLGALPGAWGGVVWQAVLAVVGASSLLVGARAVVRALDARLDVATGPVVALLSLVFVLKVFRNSLAIGQTDMFVVGAGVAGALLWSRGARAQSAAGGVLGLIATLKFQTLGVWPLLVLRGRWAAAAVMPVAFGGVLLVGALVFGWERNLELLGTAFGGPLRLLGLGAAGAESVAFDLTFGRSVSLPSMAARAFGEGAAVVAAAVGGVGGLALGWAVYALHGVPMWSRRGSFFGEDGAARSGVAIAEFSLVLVAILALSPHTTSRHTVALVPLAMLGAALVTMPSIAVWKRGVVAALGLAMAWGPPREIGGPFVGILAFAFWTLWVTLGWARGRLGAAGASPA